MTFIKTGCPQPRCGGHKSLSIHSVQLIPTKTRQNDCMGCSSCVDVRKLFACSIILATLLKLLQGSAQRSNPNLSFNKASFTMRRVSANTDIQLSFNCPNCRQLKSKFLGQKTRSQHETRTKKIFPLLSSIYWLACNLIFSVKFSLKSTWYSTSLEQFTLAKSCENNAAREYDNKQKKKQEDKRETSSWRCPKFVA